MFNFLKRATNPLPEIVSIISYEPTLITIPFLDKVAKTFYKHTNYKFDTYGDVFDLLEFLEENEVIILREIPDSQLTEITKVYYG
jgi:hypothetical protein